MNYSRKTEKYLDSFPRKVANELVKFRMNNKLTQKEMSEKLEIDFEGLIKVEFNFPGIKNSSYKKVWNKLNKLNKSVM